MVKLIPIESDGSVFHVHKKLLTFRSTYFEEVLQNELQYEFHLDTDSSTLGLFVEWVYTDSVPFKNSPEGFRQLFSLFILAQKLCKQPRLGDLVMNRIREHCRHGLEMSLLLDTIRSCYGEIEAESPLRRWLLKYVAWTIVNKELDLENYTSLVEDGSAVDLIQTLIDAPAPFRDPLGEPDCKYHAHAEDVECAARNLSGNGQFAE